VYARPFSNPFIEGILIERVAHITRVSLDAASGGTVVNADATRGLEGGIALSGEAITLNGAGVGGLGALRSLSGNNTVAGSVVFMVTDSTIGTDAGSQLTVSSAVDGSASSLTKVGPGTLTLSGTQTYPTLTTSAGTTNVGSPVGTGNSTINANATTNIGASRTLTALNIGAGARVTLGAPAPAAWEELALADLGLGGGGVQAVPEPGAVSLLLLGALVLIGRRRRRAR
jgi:autotransporter-associated beta strand protein